MADYEGLSLYFNEPLSTKLFIPIFSNYSIAVTAY